MADLVVTPPGKLSFPHVFVAKSAAPGAEPRFSAILLFSPEAQQSPEYKALRAAVAAAIDEEFGANKSKDASFVRSMRLPFRNAAEKEYKGYDEGFVFISAWAKEDRRPGVVDVNSADIIDKTLVYPGAMARFAVRPFAYSTSGNKGVALSLVHVQVLSSDRNKYPPLDGSKPAKDTFAAHAVPQEFAHAGGGTSSSPADDDIPF